MTLLEPSDHRVALRDRGELRPVDVERQDSRELRPDRLRVGRSPDLGRDRGAGLPQAYADRRPLALDAEREVKVAFVIRSSWAAGVKPSRKRALALREYGPCGSSRIVSALESFGGVGADNYARRPRRRDGRATRTDVA